MTGIKGVFILLTAALTLTLALNANARPDCHRTTPGTSDIGDTCEQGTWYEKSGGNPDRCNLRTGEDVPMSRANGGC